MQTKSSNIKSVAYYVITFKIQEKCSKINFKGANMSFLVQASLSIVNEHNYSRNYVWFIIDKIID